MIFIQSHVKYSVWLIIATLIATNFIVVMLSTVAAGESRQTISGVKAVQCRELKPFDNIDDAIYQFYINLDSGCLFEMPLEKLEEIWHITIASNVKQSPGYLENLKASPDLESKTNHPFEISANYDQDGQLAEFRISITDSYAREYGTLFIDSHFPKMLPRPLQTFRHEFPKYCKPSPNNPLGSTGKKENAVYYWLNSNMTRLIYLEDGCNVTKITIMNSVPPFAQMRNNTFGELLCH